MIIGEKRKEKEVFLIHLHWQQTPKAYFIGCLVQHPVHMQSHAMIYS